MTTKQPLAKNDVRPFNTAAVGKPRPSAGMFYLEDRDLPAPAEREGEDPPGHWGNGPDAKGRIRAIRGRKFYWHSDPGAQQATMHLSQPRYKKHEHHKPNQTRPNAVVLPPGRELTQRLHITGLTHDEVVMLLATVQPHRLLRHVSKRTQYAQRAGGGKPFGLGAIEATDIDVKLNTASARYSASTADTPSFDLTPGWFKDHAGLVNTHLGQLARVLDRQGLGRWEPTVSYPIGLPWSQSNNPEFVRSFKFFARYSGRKVGQQPRWKPLPTLPENADAPAFTPWLEY